MDLILILLAIILPPLAVLLSDGLTIQLVLNIILTFLGWLPGLIHALWVVLVKNKKTDA